MHQAGSRAPPNLFYAPGAQGETVLRVSLQVRHCCLLPAKRRCAAKSRYDTACSWKLQKGAAGCESGRRGVRRDGGGAGSGPGGSRYAFESARLPAFATYPCLPGCARAWAARASASEMTPACLKIQLPGQSTFYKVIFFLKAG